jgi:cytochrome c oxidase assembly protein subunit 15
MAHLMGGMTTLALLWWLSLTLSSTHIFVLKNPKLLKHLQLWAGFGLLVLSVQIMLGGWTSANYAALVCTDFPFCHSHLQVDVEFFKALKLTIMDLSQSYSDPTQNDARMTIHMIHRMGALITGLVVGGLSLLLLLQRSSLWLQNLGWLILILLIIQISLGIANILALMPLPISVAHNAVAALLLLALVTLNFSLYKNPKHPPYEK